MQQNSENVDSGYENIQSCRMFSIITDIEEKKSNNTRLCWQSSCETQ